MSETRKTMATALLVVLAIAAFAAAAITLTNITQWTVQAQTAPIVKVAGPDAVNSSYILTSIHAGTASDGTNRTYITITGFRGDPTKYDNVLKICNKDTIASYSVQLVYRGIIGTSSWNNYVKYLKFWINNQGPLQVDASTTSGSATPAVTVSANSCVPVSVEVLVDGSLPDSMLGQPLITVEIDVVSSH
ncbi:MAG: hypothetical protein ABWK01_04995 [Infirmifilum sp.]